MNMILAFLFNFFICILFSSNLAKHDVHISFAEAEIQNHEIAGKINFYRDDFFKALKILNGGNLKGLSPAMYEKLKYEYLKKNFKIIVNGKNNLNLQIVSNSEDEYSIWFNFVFKTDEEIKKVRLSCKTLFELYDDQMNMFMLKFNGKEQSVVFQQSETVVEIII